MDVGRVNIALTRKRLASSAWPQSRPKKDGPLCIPVRIKDIQVYSPAQVYFPGFISAHNCGPRSTMTDF